MQSEPKEKGKMDILPFLCASIIVCTVITLVLYGQGRVDAEARADEWHRKWEKVTSKYHDLLTTSQAGVEMHRDGSVSFANDTILGTGTINGVELTEENTVRTPDGRIRYWPPESKVAE